MANKNNYSESDPRYHTANVKKMLTDTSSHMREDINRIDDPRAQALFETSAEVLEGLVKAFDDYDAKAEKAWK